MENNSQIWFRISKLPDLTLMKYASLEGNGIGGVLEKHLAFLRLLNRKGIISNISFHLFYIYISNKDFEGDKLEILLLVRGNEDSLANIKPLILASPLSDFYKFDEVIKYKKNGLDVEKEVSLENILEYKEAKDLTFNNCSFLSKSETLLSTPGLSEENYYVIREWEMNDDGRLYSMFKMFESIDKDCIYRVDLYPVERAELLRKTLSKPMALLRNKQDGSFSKSSRDYDGKDTLSRYEKMLDDFESSPHFITNIVTFSNDLDTSETIIDSAGSEALLKGKYTISSFRGVFNPLSFLNDDNNELSNIRTKMVAKSSPKGMIVCKEEVQNLLLNYLPVFFTLEEVAPFFRFPALYDGEVIQKGKETAPPIVDKKGSLYIGKDESGYDVYFPLKMFPKHAFFSGVPGSGKTNTMYHFVSSLHKKGINFLVLEPAKKEYRALLNDPEMEDVYIFSPNANMQFPLHINPFELPKGCVISEHIQTLKGVFEGAFPLDNPMPFFLDKGIETVYSDLGWNYDDIYTGNETYADGKKKEFPSMSQLYKKLEELVEVMDYGAEVKGNLKSALNVRIGSLLQREMGDVFDVTRSTFSPEEWLNKSVIIELESMGAGPANFLNLMLCALIREALKVDPVCQEEIRHVIFIEEAHNLIGPESEESPGQEADAKVSATAFIVKMLAEVRALKEGIVIADQLPTKMADEVLKNTGLKIGLRITSQDDRSLLGGTMSAKGIQLEQMATFEPGQALVFYEGLMRPFQVRINEYGGEIKDKEEKERWTTPKDNSGLLELLKNRDSYNETVDKSINIYGRRYYSRFKAFVDSLNKHMDRIHDIEETVEEIGNYREKAEEIENTSLMNDEEKEAFYDSYYEMETKLNNKVESFNHKLIIELIKNELVDVKTLDRLKKNRWKKSGISSDLFKGITIIQIEILEYIIGFCQEYQIVFGNRNKTINAIIKETEVILPSLKRVIV